MREQPGINISREFIESLAKEYDARARSALCERHIVADTLRALRNALNKALGSAP